MIQAEKNTKAERGVGQAWQVGEMCMPFSPFQSAGGQVTAAGMGAGPTTGNGVNATLGKLCTSVPQFPHLSSEDVIVVITTQGGLE